MIDHCTFNNRFFYYAGSLTNSCSCLYNCHYNTHMNITANITAGENFDILDANGNRILTFHNLKSKVPNKGVPGLRAFSELKKPDDSGGKLRILEPR